MQLRWLENAYSRPFFLRAILTCKAGHIDLLFAMRSGSLLGLCMQDCKSPCAVVMICPTLINI